MFYKLGQQQALNDVGIQQSGGPGAFLGNAEMYPVLSKLNPEMRDAFASSFMANPGGGMQGVEVAPSGLVDPSQGPLRFNYQLDPYGEDGKQWQFNPVKQTFPQGNPAQQPQPSTSQAT